MIAPRSVESVDGGVSSRQASQLLRRDTGLVWGVKETFLDYIRGWPGSTMDLAPGSGWLTDGRVYFSPDSHSPAANWWFRGGVRFRAHGGFLDVTVSDPRIETHNQGYYLTAETWNDGTWKRTLFAELHWQHVDEGEKLERSGCGEDEIQTYIARAYLHTEATKLFDNTYPAGELLAPVVVRTAQKLQFYEES